ncbi:MAG: hypothetical protein ABIN36_14375 [Ferruginibacter sp.]
MSCFIAWRMPGVCSMMPWTMISNVPDMLWNRYSSFMLLKGRAKKEALNFAEIKEVCQQKAVPILAGLGNWMREQYVEVTPKSAISKM